MLLGRLRIWGKLILLSVIPLLAVVALTVPIVLGRVDQAERADLTARTVDVAGRVGSLMQDLQQERLLSVGLLLGTVDQTRLALQMSASTDRVTDIRQDLGADLPPNVARSIDQVRGLADLRLAVLAHRVSPEETMVTYGSVIVSILRSLGLAEDLDTATAEGRQVLALEALLIADEATTSQVTAMAVYAHSRSARSLAMINTGRATAVGALSRVLAMATPSQIALRELVDEAFVSRFGDQTAVDPLTATNRFSAESLFATIESFTALGNFVQKRIVADIADAVESHRGRAMTTAYAIGGGTLLVVIVVLALGFAIAIAIAQPLIQLRASAERVARAAEQELVRVADDEADLTEPIRLDTLQVNSQDEIGDLARAFDRVQNTAALLVERQALSRRNIAEMFGHVGRRTHNLASRQIALVDGLEREETDAPRLRQLYRLDHLSNRLRRNASSLIVLSESDRVDEYLTPVSLTDVARLALAEIEGYERVDVRASGDVPLSPVIVADLVLVIAELMENATMFSPPNTRVAVTAEQTRAGAKLTIVDHGIGMSPERLAEENARFTRRERLDLVPTQVLGLFVVGRLARRHRMRVLLAPTSGGGVTATIDLDGHLLAAARPPDPGDPGTVHRADELFAAAQPWNAFAIASRPQQAQLAAAADADPPASNPPASNPPANNPTPNRRRVPGATLAGTPPPAPAGVAPNPAAQQPDEVRDLIEQFESGVAQALRDARTDQ
ncbi:MAG: HAMP domain-containing protein [Dactylosporangium sp.]|nr:nitrate- and nitrite sensing domain-containing protein [Dactylosporangium sp.]NNJ60738.1 HAMP domain-containing protein [Dactylosporangium sp.]